jgi:integrase
MARLISECDWKIFSSITADSFIRWRGTATSTVGHSAKRGGNILRMGARTQNHYLETVRAFCQWSIKRKRLAVHPLADVSPVETTGQLRRQRRALTEKEITSLLVAVHARHQLAYRIILGTGLRRDELRLLRWGDVKLDAAMPCIQLRAETTKGKRADVLPLRSDLAKRLKESRGDADDSVSVCRTLPSMDTHKRYLVKAGIPFEDAEHRRADFHSLRHTYGSMLAKAGVAPRIAMSLMRHTDMRLTMNVYTDPRIFDLAGAVETLPALPCVQSSKDEAAGWRESVTTKSAAIGICLAVTGGESEQGTSTLTLVSGRLRQQKSPSGWDGLKERVKGVEPSTFTLATIPDLTRKALQTKHLMSR